MKGEIPGSSGKGSNPKRRYPTESILRLTEDNKTNATFSDHTSHHAMKGWAEIPELLHQACLMV